MRLQNELYKVISNKSHSEVENIVFNLAIAHNEYSWRYEVVGDGTFNVIRSYREYVTL